MKYQEMLAQSSAVNASYLVDVLNAVVYESCRAEDKRRAAESVASNWRLTAAQHQAIVDEACRIMQA